ncbi:hypothetical protein [Leptospira terpstrae]|uniref:Uncharacterized protein n=1 Tax=Leptospira terpstrae serovar Hualin str. LT 11-33 = ATCC 700639 TaxID=1257025 RepID=N1VWX2_9LEPT|nr:hypothetical protein [Leptospira terpstrae]EMY59901.1 hypothetical protein LEP1GSC203_0397 [Leptospira terpstrae serovar Hualin str. LT 11-33 = ATCC 700639]
MNIEDIIKIITTSIAALGGLAFLVIAFGSWYAKLLSDKIIEKEKFKNNQEIERLKANLQFNYQTQSISNALFHETQFKIYNELWVSLTDLKINMDQLWENVTNHTLQSFVRSLKKAKDSIINSALLIDEDHYSEFLELINHFENYQVGKERLLNMRINRTHYDLPNLNFPQIEKIIEDNRLNKNEIQILILRIKGEMQKVVRGNKLNQLL